MSNLYNFKKTFLLLLVILASKAAVAQVNITSVTDMSLTSIPISTSAVAPTYTQADQFILKGIASPSTLVSIYRDGSPTATGTVMSGPTGNWSFTTTPLLERATPYSFTAASGGPRSPAIYIRVDKTAPATPTLGLGGSGWSQDTDIPDGKTSEQWPTFIGWAENGSTMRIYKVPSTTPLSTLPVDGGGNWRFDGSALPYLNPGTYTFHITATDPAGNVSNPAIIPITVDITPPMAVTVTDVSCKCGASVAKTGTNTYTTTGRELVITGTITDPDTREVRIESGTGIGGNATIAGTTWTYDITNDIPILSDGTYGLQVITSDGANIVRNYLEIKVDNIPPNNTKITSITTDTDIAGDFKTNDDQLIFRGKAEPYSTIQLYLNGSLISPLAPLPPIKTNNVGDWEYNYTSVTLLPATYTLEAVATDVAGNSAAISKSPVISFIIDKTPPLEPFNLTSISTDNGESNTDFITNDNSLVFNGVAEGGTNIYLTVTQTIGGVVTTYINKQASVSGTGISMPWSIDAQLISLSAGIYTITARSSDGANSKIITQQLVIDNTPPTAPGIPNIITDTGISSSDRITSNSRPAFTGMTEPNTLVTLYLEGVAFGSAKADPGTGTWNIPYPIPLTSLAEKTHSFTVDVTDVAGNRSSKTNFEVKVDMTAPDIKITKIDNDTNIAGDYVTSDKSLTLYGTTDDATATIEVYPDGSLTPVTAILTGLTWQYTHPTNLTAGIHAFSAVGKDIAGNITGYITQNITIMEKPSAPTMSISLDSADPTDGTTNDNDLEVNGTAALGTKVTLFVGGTAITQDVLPDGTWKINTGILADGPYTISTQTMDLAGNYSDFTTLDIVIDTQKPNPPVIKSYDTDTADPTDGITSKNILTFYGDAESGTLVTLFRDGTEMAKDIPVVSGKWSFTTTALAESLHSFTAKAIDKAGNISNESSVKKIEIDITAPGKPEIKDITEDTGIPGDRKTSDQGLIFTGTTDLHTKVVLWEGTIQLGEAVVTGTAWLFDYHKTNLSNGSHTIIAKASDIAGNSTISDDFMLTINISSPNPPNITSISNDSGKSNDYITNDQEIKIFGTADPGSVIKIYRGSSDITPLSPLVVVGADGKWEFDYTGTTLDPGKYTFKAKAINDVGLESRYGNEIFIEIDITGPTGTAITAISEDRGIPGDHITSDQTLTFEGTAENKSTVILYKDNAPIGSIDVPSSGRWKFIYTESLNEGWYDFTAQAIDIAGNVGVQSAIFKVKIDITPPDPALITKISEDTAISGDWITTDNRLTFIGTAEPYASVTLYKDNKSFGVIDADDKGNWEFTYSSSFSDGTYNFRADAFDRVHTTKGADQRIIIDTKSPKITAKQQFNVLENSVVNTNIGIVTAEDLNALKNWVILNPIDPNGDGIPAFSINPITGQITVNDGTDLDCEANRSFDLLIQVDDIADNTSAAQTVTIMLKDENDVVPEIEEERSFTIQENSTTGTIVGSLPATDGDVTPTNFTGNIVSGNIDGAFAINNGKIVVANSLALDYETNPQFTLTVTVSDGVHTSASKVVTINLKDMLEITSCRGMQEGLLQASTLLTPNGDGINDFWAIKNIDSYPENEVQIIDRNGKLIYKKKGYNNDWNGTYNGGALETGTYFYIINFGPGSCPMKGYFTLIKD